MCLDYSRSERLVECCSLSLLSSTLPKHLGLSRGKAFRISSQENHATAVVGFSCLSKEHCSRATEHGQVKRCRKLDNAESQGASMLG